MNIKETTGRGLSTSNRMLAEEAYRRGITFEILPKKRFKMTDGKKSYIIRRGRISPAYNTRLAVKLTKYKNATSNFLRGLGYSAPENAVFFKHQVDRAWKWAEDILPVVLKPNDGIMGKLVFVQIDTYEEFKACFEKIAEVRNEILIEQFVEGEEYRFTFVKNEVVAVAKRVSANVVGDGVKNMEQLIIYKNEQRAQRKNPLHKKLDMGEESERVLKKQGLTFNDVPEKGQTVLSQK
ncbi:hypothetical protein [Oceanobacillus locisalsi]|uniref:ATP-grasp domain-containing protein n=1 Tax=Oceanobacillus locisalsi TaxID=546107 RepID=A0ABW3N9U1_9BACI